MRKIRKVGTLALGFLSLLTAGASGNTTAETARPTVQRTMRAFTMGDLSDFQHWDGYDGGENPFFNTQTGGFEDCSIESLGNESIQYTSDNGFGSSSNVVTGTNVGSNWNISINTTNLMRKFPDFKKYAAIVIDGTGAGIDFSDYSRLNDYDFQVAVNGNLIMIDSIALAGNTAITEAINWSYGKESVSFDFYGVVKGNQIHDGQTAEIYINVDDPLSIEQIMANVTAQDLLGESVAVNCTAEEKAKYNSANIGTYKITVTATDQYGQTATCYLNIHVVDTVAPTISLVKAFDFTVGSTLQFSKISEYISITDNGTSHGGTIGNASYTIDGQAFTSDKTWGAGDVGNHTIKVTVADSSGNSATKEFSITVRDTQAPVITMRDGGDGNLLIGLSRVLNFTKSEFLALFQATDNVTPANEIVMDVEGSFIPSKVGAYDIVVTATDKAGNVGKYTCHVTVDADLPPVFILSDALVGATAQNPLSSSHIQTIVVNALYAGRSVSNVLIDDSKYQANATTPGSYPVTYSVQVKNADDSVTTENGSMTVRVESEGEESQADSAWDRFCKWWTDGWQCLCNWFRGVFTKWKFDCWITNEEWDARFPAEGTAE